MPTYLLLTRERLNEDTKKITMSQSSKSSAHSVPGAVIHDEVEVVEVVAGGSSNDATQTCTLQDFVFDEDAKVIACLSRSMALFTVAEMRNICSTLRIKGF